MGPKAVEPVILTTRMLQQAIAGVGAQSFCSQCNSKEGSGSEFALALSLVFRRRQIDYMLRLGLRTETDLASEQAVTSHKLFARGRASPGYVLGC